MIMGFCALQAVSGRDVAADRDDVPAERLVEDEHKRA